MKSRIKVAIVTQFPKDASAPHGGVEAVSVNLVRALASCDDLDLHVVTVDSACSAITHETWTGVPVHRLPKLRRSELVNAIGAGRRQVATYLSELSPDLVHAHDTYGLMVKDCQCQGFLPYMDLYTGTRSFPERTSLGCGHGFGTGLKHHAGLTSRISFL